MDYAIGYYSAEVEEQILALPDTLAARYVVLTRRIVMLHSFIKKTQKTPPREIEVARKRMKEVRHANS